MCACVCGQEHIHPEITCEKRTQARGRELQRKRCERGKREKYGNDNEHDFVYYILEIDTPRNRQTHPISPKLELSVAFPQILSFDYVFGS